MSAINFRETPKLVREKMFNFLDDISDDIPLSIVQTYRKQIKTNSMASLKKLYEDITDLQNGILRNPFTTSNKKHTREYMRNWLYSIQKNIPKKANDNYLKQINTSKIASLKELYDNITLLLNLNENTKLTLKNVKAKTLESKVEKIQLDKVKQIKNIEFENQHVKDIYGIDDNLFDYVPKPKKQVQKKEDFSILIWANFIVTAEKSKKTQIKPESFPYNITTYPSNLNNEIQKLKDKITIEYAEGGASYNNYLDEFYHHKTLMDFGEVEICNIKGEVIDIEKIPMKVAYTLKRNWLKYADGISEKSYTDMGGKCVYELLVERLKPRWTTVDEQKLFKIFSEYVDKQTKQYLEGSPFDGKFTMESGVNVSMIRHLCDLKKVSMYALNEDSHCFEKVIHPCSNFKPIAMYCMDGHMYLIEDTAIIKSLSSSFKDEKNLVISSMLELENNENKTDETNRLYLECETFHEAIQKENMIVYLSQSNMSNEVYKYIAEHKIVPKVKCTNYGITQMTLTDKNLTIVCDPNIGDGYAWHHIKKICENGGIKFSNQRIGSLISNLRTKFYKQERRFLDKDEQLLLCKNQSEKCNLCLEVFKSFEYDHIQPLVSGGSNDISNFQALCKACHLEKTVAEKNNGLLIKVDNIASSFNKEALRIVKSDNFKQWAFIEKLDISLQSGKQSGKKDINKDNIYKIDHTKCRRNLIMYPKYDFPRYSVMDYPTIYDNGEIKTGCYFVVLDVYKIPFRGNGWYPHSLVARSLELNLITKENITHQFISSFIIDKNHFRKFAEHLIDVSNINIGLYDDGTIFCNIFEQKDLSKLIINSMVGCFAIQTSEFETINLTLDKYKASTEFIKDNVFVRSTKLNELETLNTTKPKEESQQSGDETILYSIFEKTVVNKDDMYLPIYNQIIANEAMALFELEEFIITNKGIPMERNTDAILYSGERINIKNYFWDDEKLVQKYRYDKPTHLKVESVCKFARKELYIHQELLWNQLEENDNFDELASLIYESNQGCQINGVSGGGKTFLVKKIIDLIEKNGQKCIKLAPTHKAKSHFKNGGITLHKFYFDMKLSYSYEKKNFNKLKFVDYVIVDEVSMVSENFYRMFILLIQHAPQLKFIMVGDFSQLPPVNDTYKGDYANSPALFQLCDGNRISLETNRRSDDKLFNLYNPLRSGIDNVDISLFPVQELRPFNISYTHVTRIRINKKCMEKFGVGKRFMKCNKLENNEKSQDVNIYEGLPIVSYRNDKVLDIYNSQMFTVKSINMKDKTFTVQLEDGVLTLDACDFNNHFYPAYCITIHVSQGDTINQPYTIHDWNHPMMCNSAKYVALSRASSYDYIQIAK